MFAHDDHAAVLAALRRWSPKRTIRGACAPQHSTGERHGCAVHRREERRHRSSRDAALAPCAREQRRQTVEPSNDGGSSRPFSPHRRGAPGGLLSPPPPSSSIRGEHRAIRAARSTRVLAGMTREYKLLNSHRADSRRRRWGLSSREGRRKGCPIFATIFGPQAGYGGKKRGPIPAMPHGRRRLHDALGPRYC